MQGWLGAAGLPAASSVCDRDSPAMPFPLFYLNSIYKEAIVYNLVWCSPSFCSDQLDLILRAAQKPWPKERSQHPEHRGRQLGVNQSPAGGLGIFFISQLPL